MADTWRTHGGQAPRTVRALGRAHGGHMKDTRRGEGGRRMPDTCRFKVAGTQSGHMTDTRRTQGGHKADMADMLRGLGLGISWPVFF